MVNNFKGKAVYNPSGKAKEYSYWACNFYNGCSGMCSCCYCKKGITTKVLGGDRPTLKKCFKDEEHACSIFRKEIIDNLEELRRCGLFFSFTTDPLLQDTKDLTWAAVNICLNFNIPVKILTKQVEWFDEYLGDIMRDRLSDNKYIAFGFTLTGHDELEPNCATNAERIAAMKLLHEKGFKTFASIEPIIDFESSYRMIVELCGACDLFKIGLESGKRYSKMETLTFMFNLPMFLFDYNGKRFSDSKVYFKDSILKAAGIERDKLNDGFSNCVNRDYNLFSNKMSNDRCAVIAAKPELF